MSEHQEYIDAYKAWQEQYKPKEFIEYSHETYEKLTAESDIHYLWTHHGTCETEKYTNGVREYGGSCGCWSNLGWYLCEVPWEGDEKTFISVDTEWAGPCDICNEDGEDSNIDPECPQCDGEGWTQDYFD